MKKLLIVLFLIPFVSLFSVDDGDEEFFSQFVSPDVLIILDTSGSMSWNMAGRTTWGDGTNGGDTKYNGYKVRHPFYGYAPDWYHISDTTRYGHNSRMCIVKKALYQAVDNIGGTFRWGLATFYQENNTSTSYYYQAFYYDKEDERWRSFYPTLQWRYKSTKYAKDQCMVRVPISNAQGENQSHINLIKSLINNSINNYSDKDEMRGVGGTPIAPALRGARYWYPDLIKTDNARWCRKYFVILLTDGEPTWPIDSSTIRNGEYALLAPYGSYSGSYRARQCFWEAESLRHTYVPPHGTNPAQNIDIKTYVIGLGIASSTLDSIAYYGGTEHYYPANNPDEVVQALNQIFASIISQANSFSSAQVTSVEEEFLSTQYQARMYLANFVPGMSNIWKGNLLSVRLDTGTFVLDSIPPNLIIWNAGDSLRDKLANTRNIYGVKSNSLYPFTQDYFSPSDLGLSSTSEMDTVLSLVWSGRKTMDENTKGDLGDIFHSTPLRVHSPNVFFEDDDFWKFRVSMTAIRPSVIYVGANDGMLHCFSDSTGKELWTVIPSDLISKVKDLKVEHSYYVDASPQAADVWFPSTELDSFKNEDEWKTVLFFGERGGGRGYTALDVTYPTSPNYLFGFTNDSLGYTWSEPRIFKVNRICKTSNDTVQRFIGFFGGGYWPDSLWNNLTGPGDIPGNSIYALDIYEMSDGSNDQWWNIPPASGFNMNWPFPASPTLFNRNPESDNIYDVMYIGDMDGQLWKVDLSDPDPESWEARVIFKAKQPDDSTDYDHWQPIFYPVTVVKSGQNTWLLFGTGDRANVTREGTINRFYAVLDTTPVGGNYITESQLKEVSPDGYLSSGELMHNYRGWYIKFSDYSGEHSGEKVVTFATAYLDTIIFMTFTPSAGAQTDPCSYASGLARMYKFTLGTGKILSVEDIGSGVPQAPRYSFNMSGEGHEIIQTNRQIEIKSKKTTGALKKLLWWKEY